MSEQLIHFIAPTKAVEKTWQKTSGIGHAWFFETIQRLSGVTATFHGVQLDSPLFHEINRECQLYNVTPEYVLDLETPFNWNQVRFWLSDGLKFRFSIYRPLDVETLEELNRCRPFKKRLKFVLLVRKDWNFTNTFRSLPHFIRDSVFVDFPASLMGGDAYHSWDEIPGLSKKIVQDFPSQIVQSFCPSLSFMSQGSGPNIDRVTWPRRIIKNKPKLSLVCESGEMVEALVESSVFEALKTEIEIIVPRSTHAKTRLIPKVKGVPIYKIWIHPDNEQKTIN
ncbi:MAG: hypothetical protein AAF203_10595 [Pseudomonadota bacterium]